MPIHKLEKHTEYDSISRATVNEITDSNALALWVYLITKPHDWIPREIQIREHFGWGHEKYRKGMGYLKDFGLAQWDEKRSENGRITGKTLHIYSETNARLNQRTVKPTASLPDDLKNKDILNKKEEPPIPSRFDEFWAAYPNKTGKKKCQQKWKNRKLDTLADLIIADVKRRRIDDVNWQDGYIPNPETYINGDRWQDEIKTTRANNRPLRQQAELPVQYGKQC